jgi:hypothetical protein
MKRLFALLGKFSTFKSSGSPLRMGFVPFANEVCNRTYNLMFCDKLEVFRQAVGEKPEGVWTTLLAKTPYVAGLKTIAEDPSQESSLRMLACNRLRAMRQPMPMKELLGVVVEVGKDSGLEVLAAYHDGRVRHIDTAEKITSLESTQGTMAANLRRLLHASRAAVDRIGPWLQPRIAPPTAGMIRMSFLVSDGLYFGQGLLEVMAKDELAGPIIAASEALLQSLVTRAKNTS